MAERVEGVGGQQLNTSGSSGPTGASASSMAELADQALTPDLLQHIIAFCRKNGFAETEEALSREANPVLKLGDGAGMATNENIMADFASLLQVVETAYDFFQAEYSLLLFPVFAHSFLKLLYDHSPTAARQFYDKYHTLIPRAYEEQIVDLGRIHTVAQANAHEYAQILLKNPFVVKLSKSCSKQLEPVIQRNATLKNIPKERLLIEATDLVSKLKSSVECQMGGILGHVGKNDKRHKMYYGVSREDCPYYDKRRMKGKEIKDNKKREQNAPLNDRIPLPPWSENLRTEKAKQLKESMKMAYISQDSPPSICFFTALNATGGVTSCDINDDSSVLAVGMGDSNINLYALDESRKLKRLKEVDELEKIDTDAENLHELIYDDSSAVNSVTLSGHSGPVFSVNFSPCKRLLLSSGADSTVRLWSVDNYRNAVVYRLSRPCWQVQFCQRGYYFCTAGADKTAAVWATDRMHPLRIFPDSYGQVSCVDFHPNCNYVAGGSDDKYVRVWDLLSGTCVRNFCGHKGGIRGVKFSPCGRYLVSVGGEGAVCLWDLSMQRLVGMETRTMPTVMSSIAFTREGDAFAVSHGTSSVSLYSLEAMVRGTVNQTDAFTYDPKINPEGFQMFHYATKQTPVLGLHWTRRNLLIGVGSFMQ